MPRNADFTYQPAGVTVHPDHWELFRLLYPNASKRVRALVLWDLRRARKSGKLEKLLAFHDNSPRVRALIESLPE